MTRTKLFTTALLLTAQLSVWAGPDNPHAPKTPPSGTVKEAIDAGNYTYVQIDIKGEKIWFAAPSSKYTPGEKVFVPSGGLPMKDFYSKTLDRTFEMVYFVGSIIPVNTPKKEALPSGHPPIDAPEKPKADTIDYAGIERPKGGKTVAEIYKQQDALAGKPILVRGKAVKVANGILGKNWIHLRDGSGEDGSNDLTVTTTNKVEVGAVITLKGTVVLDRDFGAGYKYGVLLENAEVQTK